jgi:hypothetical protein
VPPKAISVVSSRVRMKHPAEISRHSQYFFAVLRGDSSQIHAMTKNVERMKNAKMKNVSAKKVLRRTERSVCLQLSSMSS